MIIPIGTKADLALKPKVTIGIIATCIIIHIIASTISSGNVDRLFKVHRDLYATQVKLYVMDRNAEAGLPGYIGPDAMHGIEMMETAEDYYDLQAGLIEAMGGSYTPVPTRSLFRLQPEHQCCHHFVARNQSSYQSRTAALSWQSPQPSTALRTMV